MPYKLIEINFRNNGKSSEALNEIYELAKKINVELHSGEEISVVNLSELRKNFEKIRKSKYAIVKAKDQKAAIRACKEINVVVSYDEPDVAFARKLAEEQGFFFLSLRNLINSESSSLRIKEIKKIKENLRVLRKYNAKIIASLEPCSIFELRSARQIFELLKALGMSDDEAKKACYENAREFLEIAEKYEKGRIIRKGLEIIS